MHPQSKIALQTFFQFSLTISLAKNRTTFLNKTLQLKPGEKLSAIFKTDETYTSVSIAVPVGSYKDKPNRIVSLYQWLRFLDS